MSKRKSASTVSRRGLLKAASLVGATAVGSPVDVEAQVFAQPRPAGPTTPPPNPAAERGDHPKIDVIQGPSGSDYMADVIIRALTRKPPSQWRLAMPRSRVSRC